MASWAEAPLLVPLDGRNESVRAIPVAGRIARRLGNELRLVSVVSKPDETDARARWLSDVASTHLGDSEFTTGVAVADDVPVEIASIAEPGHLVCMATAGSVRFHSGHWGSVAEDVARALRRPIVMVGPKVAPDPGQPTQRVIAPMDGSSFSEAAAVPAAELAALLDVPLWLIAVANPIQQASEAAQHSGVVTDVEKKYLEGVAKRLESTVGIEPRHEVLQSANTERAIVDYIADDATAVLSTHGRTGLGRVFAGSVTAGVVAEARRAVVVIRPDVVA